VVAFGLGGALAELMKDVTYRLAPFDLDTARQRTTERGPQEYSQACAAPRDVEALARLRVATSRFAWARCERVTDFDINPVLVRPRGMGALAADALIVLS
jgi:hypothetical protein